MDVDSYIYGLPIEQQRIAQLIRTEIHYSVPGIVERIAYKIPFFYYGGPMLYLNAKGKGIEVGFSKGYLFRHGLEHLSDKNRKQVRSYSVYSIESYDPKVFLMLLFEAVEINKIRNGLIGS